MASVSTEATLIDGKAVAKSYRAYVKSQVQALVKAGHRAPCLAVVLVGERKDSQTYVRMKKKALKECEMGAVDRDFPDTISQEELVAEVRKLNADDSVDGILVQLPLPKHINEEAVLSEISLDKDVDGFHPLNIGKLCMRGRQPLFVPCTPKGCLELLRAYNVEISGKRAVVVGRSNIVGIPAAMLLMEANATVTICHSRTKDMPSIVKEADIVVAACGRTEMVKGEWLKPGCVVIDVGINSKEDKTRKRGYRLVGDVDFAEAKKVASQITPVPGGVGPMTIAMLLNNTLRSQARKVTFELPEFKFVQESKAE
eukprot:g1576.t1